jgi:dipeptidyl aminopeptidase/acylaminoacyl peptidase
VITASIDENAWPFAWTADGIYFSLFRRTYEVLCRVDPRSGVVDTVSDPKHIAGQFSIASHASTVAFVDAGDNEYPEINVSSLTRFAPRAITSMGNQLSPFRSARRQLIQWKSTDGTVIEGVLITPQGFDSTKKYPLLVRIHWGPNAVDRTDLEADRFYPIEQFSAKGAVILEPNYRGSIGYGEKFRALNVRNLGVGDYADVISGVDYLIGRGFVDPARVGAMGWSQGGFISAFITTYSDRFKAVSVGAGASDWTTYYVTTDQHLLGMRQYLHATPWDDPEIYKKTSPISYIKTARTPTLILHGGNDQTVPVANAFELYQALRDKGVPVRMVVYPGLGHLVYRPKQQRSVMHENLDWFSHYLWGDPLGATR